MTTHLATSSTIEFVTTQPSSHSLARVFLGTSVKNAEGETVGDVNDLVFDDHGKINAVVLGVGGFLGMGEKTVAVPFSALTVGAATDGARTLTINIGKESLKHAPMFAATDKTTMDAMRDRASELGHMTAEKANALKDQAARKIDDMTKGTPLNK